MIALARVPPPGVPGLEVLGGPYAPEQLRKLWQHVVDSYNSLPAPHAWTHLVGGSDALKTPGAPTSIAAGIAAAIGAGPSYSRENHVHPVSTAAPVDLGEALAEGASTALARANHVHKLLVRIAKAGATIGTRKALNLIDGANIAVTAVDNPGADRVDVTIAATGVAPSAAEYLVGALDATLTAERLVTNTATIGWDLTTPGQAKANTLHWTRATAPNVVSLVNATDQVAIGRSTPVETSAPAPALDVKEYRSVAGGGGAPHNRLFFSGANGTQGAESATVLGDNIADIRFRGWSSGWRDGSAIIARAAENWGASWGMGLNFYTVKPGQTNLDWTLALYDARVLAGNPPQLTGFLAMMESDSTGVAIAARNRVNVNGIAETLALYRWREDVGTMGKNIGSALTWRLRGFTASNIVLAAQIGAAWDTNQTNDTTDRDSYMVFYTMLDNALIERVRIDSMGSVMVAMAGALALGATDGFLYIPSCAGTPTGAPTAKTGMIPIVYDSVGYTLYAYAGGAWRAH